MLGALWKALGGRTTYGAQRDGPNVMLTPSAAYSGWHPCEQLTKASQLHQASTCPHNTHKVHRFFGSFFCRCAPIHSMRVAVVVAVCRCSNNGMPMMPRTTSATKSRALTLRKHTSYAKHSSLCARTLAANVYEAAEVCLCMYRYVCVCVRMCVHVSLSLLG